MAVLASFLVVLVLAFYVAVYVHELRNAQKYDRILNEHAARLRRADPFERQYTKPYVLPFAQQPRSNPFGYAPRTYPGAYGTSANQ